MQSTTRHNMLQRDSVVDLVKKQIAQNEASGNHMPYLIAATNIHVARKMVEYLNTLPKFKARAYVMSLPVEERRSVIKSFNAGLINALVCTQYMLGDGFAFTRPYCAAATFVVTGFTGYGDHWYYAQLISRCLGKDVLGFIGVKSDDPKDNPFPKDISVRPLENAEAGKKSPRYEVRTVRSTGHVGDEAYHVLDLTQPIINEYEDHCFDGATETQLLYKVMCVCTHHEDAAHVAAALNFSHQLEKQVTASLASSPVSIGHSVVPVSVEATIEATSNTVNDLKVVTDV